jgi:Cdc6-like AAA superfamily ATPase
MFMNLAKSHSNIFLYGSSGVGKTTFAQDCLKYQALEANSTGLILPHIYVDCVEFYSEKLISNYVSLCLDNILKKYHRENVGEAKTLKRLFSFKPCRNFPQLVDYL